MTNVLNAFDKVHKKIFKKNYDHQMFTNVPSWFKILKNLNVLICNRLFSKQYKTYFRAVQYIENVAICILHIYASILQ